MRPRGISQNQLARDLDVPVSRVAGLVAGTRAITADTALRLAATFATSAELWLNLQSAYDLRVARRATGEMIAAQVRRSARPWPKRRGPQRPPSRAGP